MAKKNNAPKTKKCIIIILPAILFICVAMIWHVLNSKHTANLNGRNFKINVTATKVKTYTLPITVSAIGSLSAKKSITISPEIAGKIHTVLFQYGQTVRKNQPLYQLNNQLFQAQYLAAQSNLHLSQLTYQRALRLIRRNVISIQSLDQAQSTYQDKKSALKVLQVKLNKMQIKAPFSGVIGASKVDAGQYVSVGEPLVKLVDKADLIAKFSVPEQYLRQVKIGQKVTIKSSAFLRQTFTGLVTYVSPSIDPDSRTIMIWADIPNPNLLLAPGLFVHVALTIRVKKRCHLNSTTNINTHC